VSEQRLTLREWAAELSPEHKRLTLEEATLFALISCNDRLVMIENAVEDLSARYHLLDRWAERMLPTYRSNEDTAAIVSTQDERRP
jgi:hypothetical protein